MDTSRFSHSHGIMIDSEPPSFAAGHCGDVGWSVGLCTGASSCQSSEGSCFQSTRGLAGSVGCDWNRRLCGESRVRPGPALIPPTSPKLSWLLYFIRFCSDTATEPLALSQQNVSKQPTGTCLCPVLQHNNNKIIRGEKKGWSHTTSRSTVLVERLSKAAGVVLHLRTRCPQLCKAQRQCLPQGAKCEGR